LRLALQHIKSRQRFYAILFFDVLHHPLALGNLPWIEFVLLVFIRVVAAPEFQLDRRAFYTQGFAESGNQKTLIGRGDVFSLIAVDDDGRRVVAALVGIFEADAPASYQRGLVGVLGMLQDFGESVGGDGLAGGAVDAVNLLQQLAHASSV